MIYPEADKLEEWGSKYALVALAAKRAKQIKAGAPIAVDTHSRNPLTIALEEIAAGKIICEVDDHDIIIPSAVPPEVAELLAIPLEADLETEEIASEAVSSVTEELDEEEYLEEEEDDEEDEHPLGADDVWKEVLSEDGEEAVASPIVVDPDAVGIEGIGAESQASDEDKPKKRGRKRAVPVEEVPELEEMPELEASEDESEDE